MSVQNIFGEFINIELKENGSDISVTRENCNEYVDLCMKYYLETSIASSFDAFKRGFQKLCRGQVLKIVHSLDEENKRKLLFFVTGSDRAPIKGLANVRFVISKNGFHSDRLPTAHTCFNHLLLSE